MNHLIFNRFERTLVLRLVLEMQKPATPLAKLALLDPRIRLTDWGFDMRKFNYSRIQLVLSLVKIALLIIWLALKILTDFQQL